MKMFDRKAFKASGKANFMRNYWPMVAVCVLLYITVAASGYTITVNINDSDLGKLMSFDIRNIKLLRPLVAVAATAGIFSGVFNLAVKILAVNPYQVGASRFLMVNRYDEKAQFPLVGSGFSKNFGNVILTQFLKDLYTILWTLLLIVPGIVKGYAYFCVPYILAENPDMSHDRAIQLSCQMTSGWKGDMFITDLSFILWWILNALTLGILGIFYLYPYVCGTRAEIYGFLRRTALENGVTTTAELMGFGETSADTSDSWYN